jgi:hypothetical protein
VCVIKEDVVGADCEDSDIANMSLPYTGRLLLDMDKSLEKTSLNYLSNWKLEQNCHNELVLPSMACEIASVPDMLIIPKKP